MAAPRSRSSRRATGSGGGPGRFRLRTGRRSRWGPSSCYPATTRSRPWRPSSGSGSGTRGCATESASRGAGPRPALSGSRSPCARSSWRSSGLAGRPSVRELLDSLAIDAGAREAILARAEISSRELGRRGPGHRPDRPRPHRQRAVPERRRRQPGAGARAGEAARPRRAARRPGGAGRVVGRGGAGDDGIRARCRGRALHRRGPGERHRPGPVRATAAAGEARGAGGGPLRARGEAVRAALRAGAGRRGAQRPRALLVLDRDRA